jgi:hypothetical protein
MSLLICYQPANAQKGWKHKKKFPNQKNNVYFYWGYNRSGYTPSNVTFWGPDYNFTAFDLRASDRPTKDIAVYFRPQSISVPQFNIRLGWYYKEGWDLSIGYDHMKYVMRKGQTLRLNGVIEGTDSLDGTYTDSDGEIPIKHEELHYENTNGLNYISLQLNNTKPLYETNNRNFAIQRRWGFGAGPVVTQTDFLWNYREYHSKFKVGGYGISLGGAFRFDFIRRFFIQSDLTVGMIHLPKNATIQNQGHYAKQVFGFMEFDLVAGIFFYLPDNGRCDDCPDW